MPRRPFFMLPRDVVNAEPYVSLSYRARVLYEVLMGYGSQERNDGVFDRQSMAKAIANGMPFAMPKQIAADLNELENRHLIEHVNRNGNGTVLGFVLSDFLTVNQTAASRDEIASIRSTAGKRGAQARWKHGNEPSGAHGKEPMAGAMPEMAKDHGKADSREREREISTLDTSTPSPSRDPVFEPDFDEPEPPPPSRNGAGEVHELPPRGERDYATQLLQHFCARTATTWSGRKWTDLILERSRELAAQRGTQSFITLDAHKALIDHALQKPWWTGAPSPAVIWSANTFETLTQTLPATTTQRIDPLDDPELDPETRAALIEAYGRDPDHPTL
jgi:hypothetical protein